MVRQTDCLSDAEVEGLLHGPMPADAERHLSLCASCRKRLVARHAVTAEPEPAAIPPTLVAEAKRMGRGEHPRPAPMWAAAMAATLALAFAGLYVWRAPSTADDTMRDVSRDMPARVSAPVLLDPPDGARLTDRSLELRWEPRQGVMRYDIRVVDARGDVVIEQSSATAAVTLAASRDSLRSGERYFWFVRARWPDGRVAESGIRSFIAGP